MTKEDTLGPFAFTDDQWRTYQQIPHQGYSHRHHLEHVFNSWLASRLTLEKIAIALAKRKSRDWDSMSGALHIAAIHAEYPNADAILALLVDDTQR